MYVIMRNLSSLFVFKFFFNSFDDFFFAYTFSTPYVL
jgi:hypothetical protein